MTDIKTWREYLNELPVTNDDVRTAMLNEIDDLRAALVKTSEDVVNITRERNVLEASANKWFDITVQLSRELKETKVHFANLMRESEMLYQGIVDERNALEEKITEMNLQYISDFGQLQEREPTMITVSQHDLLKDIINNTERHDKIIIGLDSVSRTMTIVYRDMDDEWFKEMLELDGIDKF